MRYYPAGLGDTSGDPMCTAQRLQMSGDAWYVQSTTGLDSAGSYGKDRQKPLATLAQAVSNSTDGDVIVLMPGHVETITSTLTIAKSLYVVGAGTPGTATGAQIRCNLNAAACINVTAPGVELRNIYSPPALTTTAFSRILLASTATNFLLASWVVETSSTDSGLWLTYATTSPTAVRLENCTFTSTVATSGALQPSRPFSLGGSAGLEVVGCTISDGIYGFSAPAIISISAFHYVEGLTLARGAELSIAGAWPGRVNAQTADGSGKVTW